MGRLEKIIADVKLGKYRKIQDGGMVDYMRQLKNLKAIGVPYATKEYGSSSTVYTTNANNEKVAYVYFDGKPGAGYHVCNMVRKDVDAWIEKNEGFDYARYREANYREQCFNIEALLAGCGKQMVGIDISGCYFNTIFKLGYITEKTFASANKKVDEWKRGRNVAVGALAKEEVFALHGVARPEEPITISDEKKKAIRHHIIQTVWEMFVELMNEVLKGEFYMFLTDCIYVDQSKVGLVMDFFEKRGYGCKTKVYYLAKVDKDNEVVWWWDYEKTKEVKVHSGARDGGKGVDVKGGWKYYNYCSSMLYENLKSTI